MYEKRERERERKREREKEREREKSFMIVMIYECPEVRCDNMTNAKNSPGAGDT